MAEDPKDPTQPAVADSASLEADAIMGLIERTINTHTGGRLAGVDVNALMAQAFGPAHGTGAAQIAPDHSEQITEVGDDASVQSTITGFDPPVSADTTAASSAAELASTAEPDDFDDPYDDDDFDDLDPELLASIEAEFDQVSQEIERISALPQSWGRESIDALLDMAKEFGKRSEEATGIPLWRQKIDQLLGAFVEKAVLDGAQMDALGKINFSLNNETFAKHGAPLLSSIMAAFKENFELKIPLAELLGLVEKRPRLKGAKGRPKNRGAKPRRPGGRSGDRRTQRRRPASPNAHAAARATLKPDQHPDLADLPDLPDLKVKFDLQDIFQGLIEKTKREDDAAAALEAEAASAEAEAAEAEAPAEAAEAQAAELVDVNGGSAHDPAAVSTPVADAEPSATPVPLAFVSPAATPTSSDDGPPAPIASDVVSPAPAMPDEVLATPSEATPFEATPQDLGAGSAPEAGPKPPPKAPGPAPRKLETPIPRTFFSDTRIGNTRIADTAISDRNFFDK